MKPGVLYKRETLVITITTRLRNAAGPHLGAAPRDALRRRSQRNRQSRDEKEDT